MGATQGKRWWLFELLIVLSYFAVPICVETGYVTKLLLYLNGDREVFYKYFNFVFYAVYMIVLLCIYRNEMKVAIKDMRIEFLKYMCVAFVFILVFVVISAIVLSRVGIEESVNQVAVDNAVSGFGLNKLAVVFMGPVAEELIYRNYLYRLMRGSKSDICRIAAAILFTSLVFMLSHCNIYDLITFDMYQILSLLPLLFMGIGFACIKEKTSNIICPMIVHMFLNLIALG